MSKKEITGLKFTRLLVIKDSGKRRPKRGGIIWTCLCDCGKQINVRGDHLRRGITKSCGCYNKDIHKKLKIRLTHGKSKSKTYAIWNGMKQRCINPHVREYHRYGGRGITVCERWFKYENFLEDMGECPEGHSIDRIDNNLGYYKNNCKWSTDKEQSNNRCSCVLITLDGITMNMKQWAEKYSISNKTLHKRIKDGWDIEMAIKTPSRRIK